MTIEKLIDIILFGDIEEAPLSLLEDKINLSIIEHPKYPGLIKEDVDTEIYIRLCVAATITDLCNKGELKY